MKQSEFNRIVNADIQRLMVPKMHLYIVAVLSRSNHTDDIFVMATSEDDAIDKVLDTQAYDIRTLTCGEVQVSV